MKKCDKCNQWRKWHDALKIENKRLMIKADELTETARNLSLELDQLRSDQFRALPF